MFFLDDDDGGGRPFAASAGRPRSCRQHRWPWIRARSHHWGTLRVFSPSTWPPLTRFSRRRTTVRSPPQDTEASRVVTDRLRAATKIVRRDVRRRDRGQRPQLQKTPASLIRNHQSGGTAATVAGDVGPGFHHWPPGHIPQDTDPKLLFRTRSPTQNTFGETFGEARATTVESSFASHTGRLRGQRPQLQKKAESDTLSL